MDDFEDGVSLDCDIAKEIRDVISDATVGTWETVGTTFKSHTSDTSDERL